VKNPLDGFQDKLPSMPDWRTCSDWICYHAKENMRAFGYYSLVFLLLGAFMTTLYITTNYDYISNYAEYLAFMTLHPELTLGSVLIMLILASLISLQLIKME